MEALVPVLVEHGLPGVVITALAWAYWREREARVKELRETLVAITDNTRALDSLTDVIKAGRR